MKLTCRIILTLTCLTASLSYFASAARAEFRLVVSPPSTSITIKPGEVSQKVIKITNQDQRPQTIKAEISDFLVQDDQGTPVKVKGETSGRYFAKPWITLSRDTIELAPQETKEVIVLIDVPQDALAGGHYAGVYFRPANTAKPDSTGAIIIPEVGSLFAITVPGDITYDAAITSFTTKSSLFEYGPIDFTAIVENQSTTHITPSPYIEVSDMFGRELTKISLDSLNIFPFTARTLTATWDNVWGLGRYSAKLTIPYGESYAATRSLYFWILPYRLIAAILVCLLVVIATTVLIRRHLRHRQDTRDQEIELLKRRLVELENRR